MSSPHRILYDLLRAPFARPDPGASGTITVDRHMAVYPIITADAEGRTLAQPTKAGVICTVELKTDGGTLTLTVTGGYNANADTDITFADAGDFVTFISVDIGSSCCWRVLAQEGTDASVEDFEADQLSVVTLTLGGTALTATAEELNQLDGNILDDLETTAGSGITGGTGSSCVSSVEKVGALYKTTIVIDLTGLHSTAGDDIIGVDGTDNPCYIGQITAARNGTIFAGKVTCLEAPAGGDPDIDLYSAEEGTGVEDGAISGLTGTQLLNAGDHAADAFKSLTAFPAADEYLYLVAGDTTDGDYTAGIMVIELWGK